MAIGDPGGIGAPSGPGPGGDGDRDRDRGRSGRGMGDVPAGQRGRDMPSGRTGRGDPESRSRGQQAALGNFGYGASRIGPGRGVNPGRGYAGPAPQPGGRGQGFGFDLPGGASPQSRATRAEAVAEQRAMAAKAAGAIIGFLVAGPMGIAGGGKLGAFAMDQLAPDEKEAEEAIASGVGFDEMFGTGRQSVQGSTDPARGGREPGEGPSIERRTPAPQATPSQAQPAFAGGDPLEIDEQGLSAADRYFMEQYGFYRPFPRGSDEEKAQTRTVARAPALAYMARVNADIRRSRAAARQPTTV